MDADQIKALHKHILEKIEDVKGDIKSYKLNAKPVAPDNAIGRLTRLEAMNSKSINEAALRTSKEGLVKLERALNMLSAPDFGYCMACEEPIPYARLMIVPETVFCVHCAQKQCE